MQKSEPAVPFSIQSKSRIFRFCTATGLQGLGPNQLPVEWLLVIVFLVTKRLLHETNHSPLPISEVSDVCLCFCTIGTGYRVRLVHQFVSGWKRLVKHIYIGSTYLHQAVFGCILLLFNDVDNCYYYVVSMELSVSWKDVPTATQEILAVCGTWRPITVYRRAHRWYVTQATWIHCKPFHAVSRRSIIIISETNSSS